MGYTSIPNPDLRPETSRSFEGGVRIANAFGSFDVTPSTPNTTISSSRWRPRAGLALARDALDLPMGQSHRRRGQRSRGTRRGPPGGGRQRQLRLRLCRRRHDRRPAAARCRSSRSIRSRR
ncbi:MAG: hypothetical protein WDN24_05535 [Sphingomonas sp.]